MAMELDRDCPHCETEQTFYRAAATTVHFGEKVKWGCPDCDYGFVTIDSTVDTSTA